MDNDYKWIKLLTIDGWISINTEHIESVKRIRPNGAIAMRMTSGDLHLVHTKKAIKKLEEIISTKI